MQELNIAESPSLAFPYPKMRGECRANSFRNLVERFDHGIMVVALGGNVLFANDAAARLFLCSPEDLAGRHWGFPLTLGEIMEIEVPQYEGGEVSVEMQVSDIIWDGGKPAYVVSLHNISHYRKLKASLQKSNDRLRALLNASPLAIIMLDSELRVMLWSQVAEKLFGWSERELVGSGFPVHSSDGGDDIQQCCSTALQGRPVCGVELVQQQRRDGTTLEISVWVAPLYNNHALSGGVLLLVEDITAHKRAEARIQFLSNRNALTGLPNRAMLLQTVDGTIAAHGGRDGVVMAVFYLGIDRFRNITESLGYEDADDLLCKVSECLKQVIRDNDVISHLGGDEFALFLTGIQDARAIGSIAKKILMTLSDPIPLNDGVEVFVTVSMGITIFPADGRLGEELLRKAEAAMRRAKENAGSSFQFFSPNTNTCSVERLSLESGLRHALVREELLLHFQPQVDIGTGRIIGSEALVRWNHPEFGEMSPGRFIGIAEECGLIIPLGEWVLNSACRQAVAWREMGLKAVPVAVNVSPLQFHSNFHRTVEKVLRETGLDPAMLELELTEGAVMRDAEAAVKTLGKLKDIGIRISIDDFGMGYSSLSYLKRFPIDKLKIDQSFVRDVPGDSDSEAIVNAIVGLAKSLNLKVIAEGVENAAQLDFIRSLDCDEVQGFYFWHPMPAEKFIELLGS
jgi:diguanylate cyclase (GGDEF)-like protein/PAS domain S-box-containing protein